MYEIVIKMHSRSVVPIWRDIIVRDIQLGYRTEHGNVRLRNGGPGC